MTNNGQHMNILFYGNGSSGNHGCEAIVRGTVALLGQENGYTVFSDKPHEDELYGLSELADIKSAKEKRRKDLAFLKAYAKLKLSGSFTEMDGLYYLSGIKKQQGRTDLALSVGGDNYCYGNTEIYAYLNAKYRKAGIKTVLWGCSIEPDVVVKPKVSEDLRSYSMVVARESITYNAVKDIGANAVQMPDPAFSMLPQACDIDHRISCGNTIGINLSPLIISSEEVEGAAYSNYKALIRHILDNTDANIALIPHVVWAHNDDRIPLRRLYDDFNRDDRLILVDDHTAPELKYIISKCDFFVGARTHATIAAYSNCVPTLVVGYSVKARGIARDLFGTEDGYVLPVQQLENSNELALAFDKLYSKRHDIKAYLADRLPNYMTDVHSIHKLLEDIAST